jgi:hypothetical protein
MTLITVSGGGGKMGYPEMEFLNGIFSQGLWAKT